MSSEDNQWFSDFVKGGGAKALLVKRTLAENILMFASSVLKKTARIVTGDVLSRKSLKRAKAAGRSHVS